MDFLVYTNIGLGAALFGFNLKFYFDYKKGQTKYPVETHLLYNLIGLLVFMFLSGYLIGPFSK